MKKQVTVKCEFVGEIKAAPAVLNQISIWAFESAQRYEQLGLHALADSAIKARDTIYNELSSIGYYD